MPAGGRRPNPPPLGYGPGDARAITKYNREVFERFLRKVRRLPGRGATRRREIGHQNLFDTLVHVLNVHEVWMVYIVPGRHRELRALFEAEYRHPTDWPGLLAYARRVWTGVEATVAGVDARGLGRVVSAPWMPGRYTVRDALLQTTLEQAHHLGEVIGALWQDDTPPPEMTWIDVRRETAYRDRHRRK